MSIDYTACPEGQPAEPGNAQIEVCPRCGRKGAAIRYTKPLGGVWGYVIHKMHREPAGVGFGRVDDSCSIYKGE